MDGQLDAHFINHIEQKLENSRFTRVDSDIIDKLIEKEEDVKSNLNTKQEENLEIVFKSQVPSDTNTYDINFKALSENDAPVIITQSEFMRRMKDMSALGGGGMNYYGELPDSYTFVVNTSHKLVKNVIEQKEKELANEISKTESKLKPINDEKAKLEKELKDKKDEEIPEDKKNKKIELENKINEIKQQKESKLSEFGKNNKLVKQLIDLALLSNNMLKGESLNKFVKRSIELIEE